MSRGAVENLLFDQNGPQRLAFVAHPGMHGRHQLVAGDEIHLHGENAKKQVHIGGKEGIGLRHVVSRKLGRYLMFCC